MLSQCGQAEAQIVLAQPARFNSELLRPFYAVAISCSLCRGLVIGGRPPGMLPSGIMQLAHQIADMFLNW